MKAKDVPQCITSSFTIAFLLFMFCILFDSCFLTLAHCWTTFGKGSVPSPHYLLYLPCCLFYIWIVYSLLHFFHPSHLRFPGPRETCHRGVSLPGVDEPGAPVDGLAACPPPCDCCRVDKAPGQMLRLQTVSHQGLQVGMPVQVNWHIDTCRYYLFCMWHKMTKQKLFKQGWKSKYEWNFSSSNGHLSLSPKRPNVKNALTAEMCMFAAWYKKQHWPLHLILLLLTTVCDCFF